MEQKYVLHPGVVCSAAEGKRYFVSASTLAYLYGVEIKECRIADPLEAASPQTEKSREIHLYPGLEQKEGSSSLLVTSSLSYAWPLEKRE